MLYPRLVMQAVARILPQELLHKSMLNSSFTWATQFSGMGCPETAMGMVVQEAAAIGLSCKPRQLYSCEIDSQCRSYLETAYPSDSCMFGDILSFQPGDKRMSQRGFQYKLARRRSRPLASTAFCYRHKCQCPVPKAVNFLVAGSPCTDFSSAGLQAGLNGKTMEPTLVFCKTIDHADCGLQENVPNFPMLLESRHHPRQVRRTDCSPADLGYGSIQSRPRVYRPIGPRDGTFHFNPSELYTEVCAQVRSRLPHVTLDAILGTAPADEVNAVLAAANEKVGCKGKSFRQLLSKGAQRNRRRYHRLAAARPEGPMLVVSHLGDNPGRFSCVSSPVTGALPCMRRSFRELWAHGWDRPLVASELFQCMGWVDPKPLPVSLQRHRSMLGNSMHMTNIYCMMVCTLVCMPAEGLQPPEVFPERLVDRCAAAFVSALQPLSNSGHKRKAPAANPPAKRARPSTTDLESAFKRALGGG